MGLLLFTLVHIIFYNLHYVSNDDDMFRLSMGSPDGVEHVGSIVCVDPCVEHNATLFASLYILSFY